METRLAPLSDFCITNFLPTCGRRCAISTSVAEVARMHEQRSPKSLDTVF